MSSRSRAIGIFVTLAAAASVVACGGSHTTPPVGPATAARAGATAAAGVPVQISISVPSMIQTKARKPLYVSPSTASVQVSVVPVAGGTTVTTVPPVGNCVGSSCAVTLTVPTGADQFTVTLYDRQNYQGSVLSSGTVTQQVVAGQVNQIFITLSGQVASVVLNLSPTAALPAAAPGAVTLTATAYDVDGNVIMGPGNFPAIDVTSNSSNVQLSPSAITQPNGTITANYNGSSAIGLVVFTPVISGCSACTLTTATLSLSGSAGMNGLGLQAASTTVGLSGAHLGIPGPLPTATSLASSMPPVGMQGVLDSCVAWATAYALDGYYQALKQGWALIGPGSVPACTNCDPNHNFSPTFVYNSINNGVDLGASIPAAFNILTTEGVDTLSEMPYTTNVTQKPSSAQVSAAQAYVMSNAAVVPPDMYDIKAQIAQGNPVVVGIQVDSTFINLPSGQTWFATQPSVGGHAVVVIGYDDTKNAFLLQNSWGTSWGTNGLAWADYTALITHLINGNEAYIAQAAAGATAGPTPTPMATPSPTSSPIAGNITQYPVPTANAFPQGITSGPDGALWFTESGSGSIGRITTAGAFKEFPLAPPLLAGSIVPIRITSGPDGALWFTEYGDAKIGRMTTSGALNEYPIATPSSAPLGIITGPDGALWFADCGANMIGRITTGGSIDEYAVPTSQSCPNSIAVGSDGAIWFTETGANKIGRLTLLGTFLEYVVPTPNSVSGGITAGPDGALWFTALQANDVDRITTGGSISEFPIESSGALPLVGVGATILGGDIVTGTDGALYFAEAPQGSSSQQIIGRITTGGAFTAYPVLLSPGVDPEYLTRGPDGAIWYTEPAGQNGVIGRLQ